MGRQTPVERRRARARAEKREERAAKRNAAANARRKALVILSGRSPAPIDSVETFTSREAAMWIDMCEGRIDLDGNPVEAPVPVVEMFAVAIRNG